MFASSSLGHNKCWYAKAKTKNKPDWISGIFRGNVERAHFFLSEKEVVSIFFNKMAKCILIWNNLFLQIGK